MANTQPEQEKVDAIRAAIADYFDVPVEQMGAFCLAGESFDGETSQIHTMWTGLPYWHFEGFVERIKQEIEGYANRGRLQEALEEMSGENG